MASFLPKSLENLIEEFAKLPGIGPKSAQRLVIHLMQSPHANIEALGEAVLKLKNGFTFCSVCWNAAEENPCKICSDSGRDKSVVCVVEQILDVMAIEKMGKFKGVYHVLHGVLSPIDGMTPEHLKIAELIARVKSNKFSELILATNPSLEGEATAMYIARELRPLGVKLTRIARGLPVGGDLDYADEVTLSRAFLGRTAFDL